MSIFSMQVVKEPYWKFILAWIFGKTIYIQGFLAKKWQGKLWIKEGE